MPRCHVDQGHLAIPGSLHQQQRCICKLRPRTTPKTVIVESCSGRVAPTTDTNTNIDTNTNTDTDTDTDANIVTDTKTDTDTDTDISLWV